MLLMHANSREELKDARAGDIVALAGLKDTTTGDTLCDPDKPIMLERMEFPDPVIEVAVEPKTKADQEKMAVALGRLAQEDPSFRVATDPESGPDRHQGHGRAAPRHHRRPDAARVQGRRQCRRAAGGLSRDHHQDGRRSITPTRSRPAAPASSRASRSGSSRCRAGLGLSSSSTNVVGGSVPREYRSRRREGHQDRVRDRRARRLPDDRLQAPRCSTAPTTMSTRRSWRSKSRRAPASAKASPRPAPSCSSR